MYIFTLCSFFVLCILIYALWYHPHVPCVLHAMLVLSVHLYIFCLTSTTSVLGNDHRSSPMTNQSLPVFCAVVWMMVCIRSRYFSLVPVTLFVEQQTLSSINRSCVTQANNSSAQFSIFSCLHLGVANVLWPPCQTTFMKVCSITGISVQHLW